MSFDVFADGSANLPQMYREGITVLPCEYSVDGVPKTYSGDLESFDGRAYYDGLRQGKTVNTSLINTHLFLEYFTSVLKEGRDLIYVSMSSGISGTYSAAMAAANQLKEEFPDRFIHIVDSYGCGFGSGLLAVRAAALGRKGLSAGEAAPVIDAEVQHACQYFTVDDLNYLKRTGRVKGITAAIGTVLNIKPVLYGSAEGQIIACRKVRGRKHAIEALAEKYREKKLDSPEQIICISHGDCFSDAALLSELVQEITPGIPVTICMHEPFSGSHVGPGMLGLFFRGKER